MIHLRRLGGQPLVLNCDLIQFVEATPDTLITLRDGHKLIVREGVDEVVERVADFRKRIAQDAPVSRRAPAATETEASWT
jgi:flagellar protein FlbD